MRSLRLIRLGCVLLVAGWTLFAPLKPARANDLESGLVGVWFADAEFQHVKGILDLESLEFSRKSAEFGEAWSARWSGMLVGPANGDVTIHLETSHDAALEIENKRITATGDDPTGAELTLQMKQGSSYPVTVSFSKVGLLDRDFVRVTWSRDGGPHHSFLPGQSSHLSSQREQLKQDHPILVDPPGHPPELMADGQDVTVYFEPGRFGGWPANGGVWNWGDEIVVCFKRGYFDEMGEANKHSIDSDKPTENMFARSLDGGESWQLEVERFQPKGAKSQSNADRVIQFDHPDFALRCKGNKYCVSYDRCRTWSQFKQLPEVTGLDQKLTSRTDYLPNGRGDCLLFMSVNDPHVRASLQDRAFAARWEEGSRELEFMGWMTDESTPVRSVMPSTVRVSPNQLISAMRRREDGSESILDTRNWIDAYESKDNGQSWHYLSKVAETDTGRRNGNPPAMVRLRDGRLCVAYGYRATPYGVRARISQDEGKTWGPEIGLRVDGRTFDLGYPRMVERKDGKLVTIYYFTNKEQPEQHIAATIWDPRVRH